MDFSKKKRLALVLSGGGVKAAAFHIGVCIALREKGFRFAGGSPSEVELKYKNDGMTFKLYVGSSAGAVISTFLASGYSIEAILEAFENGVKSETDKFKRPSVDIGHLKPITYRDLFAVNSGNLIKFIPNLIRHKSLVTGGIESILKNGFHVNGLFTTRNLERYLRAYTLRENTFASLGVKLYIIATQLNHSRKVVFGNFPESYKIKNIKYANFATISDAVAASTSLPPVFAPYPIRNQKGKELFYFDGEIRDTLSTHVAADHDADLVISSYSIQPYHYNPEMGSLHNYGIPLIINQALYQVIQQKIEKHRDHQNQISAIYNAIDGYFKQSGLPDEHREKLLEIVSRRVNYKPEVDYIYIHPSGHDYEMFFVDHFSLKPDILSRIVHIGFRSCLQTLRQFGL